MDVDFREVEISTYRNGTQEPVRVADASERDLRFWADKGRDPLKKSAAARELEYRASLGRRGAARAASPRSNSQRQQREAAPSPEPLIVVNGARSPRAPAPLASIDLDQVARLCGMIETASDALQRFETAQQLGHLITPSPLLLTVPEGCALSMSAVMLTDIGRESYEIKGSTERGLKKTPLERIAGAAGVKWDAEKTRRLDDARDPWYCRMQAVGEVRNYDLSWRPIANHKEIDLRDGSPIVEAIIRRERSKQASQGANYKGDLGVSEIENQRVNILSNCYTKAHLRAIRSGLALRTSYTPDELAKPFFVVAVAFTGRSEDAETRRFFNRAIARSFLGDAALLYGPAAVPQLPAPEDSRGHAPPPVGRAYEAQGEAIEDDDDDWRSHIDEEDF